MLEAPALVLGAAVTNVVVSAGGPRLDHRVGADGGTLAEAAAADLTEEDDDENGALLVRCRCPAEVAVTIMAAAVASAVRK